MTYRWPWQTRQTPAITSNGTGRTPGSCEHCGGYGMICLNGSQFLCWDHYSEAMRLAYLRGVTNSEHG